jgi:hypothetical protein
MPTETAAVNQESARVFECDTIEFRELFDRRSFEFSHYLSGHPLFEIPRLIELSKKLSETGGVYYDAGDIDVGQRWVDCPSGSLSVDETIRRIRDAGAWIILRRAEEDPEYRVILNDCMSEIRGLLGRDLSTEMKVQNAIIFITSPNRISTYHIDRECNWILQIHGEKDISIFDKNDREVLPEEEIERFWTVDNNAAIYKNQYQNRATVYRLAPGRAVHVPVNAPHWVKNDNNISVTLSVNFQFRDSFRADLYRTNYYLRKMGLSPTPPGNSPLRDHLKRTAYSGARSLRRMIRKTPS